MSDYSKLQTLAENAGSVKWDWWTSNSTLRLTTEKDGRHGSDGDAISGDADGVNCPLAYREFIAEASPATVLSLLEEITTLSAQLDAECSDWSREVEQSKALAAEIDRLKAENEALRQDAERYRWLRTQNIPLQGHDFLNSHEILDRRVDAKILKEPGEAE